MERSLAAPCRRGAHGYCPAVGCECKCHRRGRNSPQPQPAQPRPYVFCRTGYHAKCPLMVDGKPCSCSCHEKAA